MVLMLMELNLTYGVNNGKARGLVELYINNLNKVVNNSFV